jgi:hypothetical protein
MKQTAVEWLVEKMTQGEFISIPKREWIEQAKAMEKEQILNAFENGEVCTLFKNEDTSEQYYNETFK